MLTASSENDSMESDEERTIQPTSVIYINENSSFTHDEKYTTDKIGPYNNKTFNKLYNYSKQYGHSGPEIKEQLKEIHETYIQHQLQKINTNIYFDMKVKLCRLDLDTIE
jgi:hypothetical protein